MKSLVLRCLVVIVSVSISAVVSSIAVAQPEYEIISLGQKGEQFSGGQAISSNGQFGAGFSSINAGSTSPTLWESKLGITVLSSVASRPYSMPEGVNDQGAIVGIGATTPFGSSPLPVIWQDGSATVLTLPAGEVIGRAYAINNSDLIVGSVDGGSVEQACTYSTDGAGTVLTQTLAGGTLTTAFGVNNAGRIVGIADDPTNAAVTKGFYLDSGDSEASDVGALTEIGHNSAIPFGVSEAGFITGSSSFNSGVNGRAFLWTDDNGMTELPLPVGTSTARGRGVNDDGWVVGIASSATSIPFLFDGKTSHRLQDIISKGDPGWDLVSGTSNGAFDISNDGTIVGRGLLNGEITGFVMVRLDGVLLGDVNRDGDVNLLDVDPFVTLLADGEFQDEADVNQDGEVNLLDVQPFVDLLAGL